MGIFFKKDKDKDLTEGLLLSYFLQVSLELLMILKKKLII